jgi:uncharacterized protein (DUF2147 family)
MTPTLLAALAAATSPVGSWMTQDGSALIRIEPCGQSLCGNVSKVLAAQPGIPDTDVHNPKAELRSRPLLGLPVLGGFSRSGTQWSGGTIYDPKTGKTYRSKLAVNADGTLKVSGCVLFICETQRWTPAR